MREEIHDLFHRLWTKSVSTPLYDKREWRKLEELIERETASEPDEAEQDKGPAREYGIPGVGILVWLGNEDESHMSMRPFKVEEISEQLVEFESGDSVIQRIVITRRRPVY